MKTVAFKDMLKVQKEPGYAVTARTLAPTRYILSNYGVTDYGLMIALGGAEEIELINVYHTGKLASNRASPGCFFLQLWPGEGKQSRRLKWDNTKLKDHLTAKGIYKKNYLYIRQNVAEAAFREKCDYMELRGVNFMGILDADGRPIKQPVQIRSTFDLYCKDGETVNGYWDVGRQKTADDSDAGFHWEMHQRVKKAVWENHWFKFWPPGGESNKPGGKYIIHVTQGVDYAEFINCKDPNGKVFSRRL